MIAEIKFALKLTCFTAVPMIALRTKGTDGLVQLKAEHVAPLRHGEGNTGVNHYKERTC